VYRSDRDRTNHLFLYDFATERETQLTSAAGRDDQPRYSPDGK
jgi:Tol biopolymer transport system component